MEIKSFALKNLGTISGFQVNQNQKPLKITEVDETDSKQEKIEASRKSYAELIQSCNNIRSGLTPTQLADKQTNSINIVNGAYYHLGLVNGNPLTGTLLTGGGFNSNFSPMIWDNPNSSVVTPEQKAALRIHQSYSQSERKEATELIAVFMNLSQLAEGRRSVASVNNDVMFTQHFPKFAQGIGLDLREPFTINGKSYFYSQGKLQTIDTGD